MMRTHIQLLHITLSQQSTSRLPTAFGFSVFSSYWGAMVLSKAAQVQQASSILRVLDGTGSMTEEDVMLGEEGEGGIVAGAREGHAIRIT